MVILSKSDMNKVSLFAVVIDFYKVGKNPVTNKEQVVIKVIDDTLNKSQSFFKGHKTYNCAYLLFNNELSEKLPWVVNVGDIIRIRWFSFQFSNNDWCDLNGLEQIFSNWMVFDAGSSYVKASEKTLKGNSDNRELFPTEIHWFN